MTSPHEPVLKLDEMLARAEDRSASCPAHGAFASRHVFGKIWSKCPACADEEGVRQAEEFKDRERCAKAHADRELIDAMLSQSGLIGRFADATFDSFDATTAAQVKARTTCRSFVESLERKAGGLWLIGPPGTGKTHLGSAMVSHLIQQRMRWAAIYSAREIIRMLRATWGKRDGRRWANEKPQTEEEVIDHLGTIDLLVLDEVGVSFGSDSETVQLFDVLDLRYKNELPTVLMSNLPAQELKPVLGDRLYDRLREGAAMLPCRWESHRGGRSKA